MDNLNPARDGPATIHWTEIERWSLKKDHEFTVRPTPHNTSQTPTDLKVLRRIMLAMREQGIEDHLISVQWCMSTFNMKMYYARFTLWRLAQNGYIQRYYRWKDHSRSSKKRWVYYWIPKQILGRT